MLSFYLSAVITENDRDKIVRIYEKYYPPMAYTAAKILGTDSDRIDDAVHEAMLKIIEHIHVIDLDDPQRAQNLFCVIVRNKALDMARSDKKAEMPIDVTDKGRIDEDLEGLILKKEAQRSLCQAIDALGDTYRDVFILKYLYDMNNAQIASLLNLSKNAVALRLYRAKIILKELLQKEDFHEQL